MSKWILMGAVLLGALSTQAGDRWGLENVREVMPGVLYRGGGNGGKEPMNAQSLKALCEAGFSSALYLYGRSGESTMSCGSNQIKYVHNWYTKDKKPLKIIYDVIQNGSGPVYAHCYYGVHASGYIAAVALRQFCGYSASQAVDYWNKYVPKSIQYKKVQDAIRNFNPYSDLKITAAQSAKYCP